MKNEVDGNKQVFKYPIAGETVCRAFSHLLITFLVEQFKDCKNALKIINPSHTNGKAIILRRECV